MIRKKDKYLLWVINEKCVYTCKYCYLKFDKTKKPIEDCDNHDNIEKIINSINRNQIDYVFLAGAEPLLNKNIDDIIKKIDSKIILCTNAIVSDDDIWIKILKQNIDAISISLDSPTSYYNDKYRVNGSWEKVIKNIEFIKKYIKENRLQTKIGIYMVLSRKNIDLIKEMFIFCEKVLKVDYFIYQPITLPLNHPLYNNLSLVPSDLEILKKQILLLRHRKSNIYVPNMKYNKLLFRTLTSYKNKKCFLKNNFIFVMPNGRYANCPCNNPTRNIRLLDDTISLTFKSNSKCDFFSEECSNIYQLINFKEVLRYVKK